MRVSAARRIEDSAPNRGHIKRGTISEKLQLSGRSKNGGAPGARSKLCGNPALGGPNRVAPQLANNHSSAGTQHPRHLVDELPGIRSKAQYRDRHDHIESAGLERKRVRVCSDKDYRSLSQVGSFLSGRQHARIDIYTGDMGTSLRQGDGERGIAAPDIKHPQPMHGAEQFTYQSLLKRVGDAPQVASAPIPVCCEQGGRVRRSLCYHDVGTLFSKSITMNSCPMANPSAAVFNRLCDEGRD